MKQKLFFKILLVLTCLQPAMSFAFQEKNPVSGVVKRSDNELLSGVSIGIGGNASSTVTKEDGTFSINAKIGDVLHLTAVGYANKEVIITHVNFYEIVLEQTSQSLSGVVVVGYGTQKRVNLSGAVDQVRAKELQNRPISNVAQGLFPT